MLCPICQTWTMVKESRMRQDNTRRRALECANLHRFSTVERVEAVKQGGNRKKEGQDGQENNG
jgi:transcriptional regulator NrdR family protein